MDGTTQDWTLGCDVSITTTFGEEVAGEVLGFDAATNLLALRQRGSSDALQHDITVIRTNYIKRINSAKRPKDTPDLRLPRFDLRELREKADRAALAAKAEAAKIGVGVSKEGQQLFDALDRTMPCRWAGKVIVVLEVVTIKEPYHVDNCELIISKANDPTLQRVRTVVENERMRLAI